MQEVSAMEVMADSEIADFLVESQDKGREAVNVKKEPKVEKGPKVEKATPADSALPQKKNKAKKAKQPGTFSFMISIESRLLVILLFPVMC